VDFNYANEIPYVIRGNDELRLVVYEKDFQPSSIELEIRHLSIKVNLQKIKFSAKPMEKQDMYELTAEIPVKDGAMLQVNSWSFFNNFGVIMLGDTQKEFEKYFSQKDLSDASVVTQYLDDALVAFPNNAKLKELSVHWKMVAETEKDQKDYAYVEEKWRVNKTATPPGEDIIKS
jgi:uncharacterized membrane protein